MAKYVVDMPMVESLFSVYGLSVKYGTDLPLLAAPVNELLRHFRQASSEATAGLAIQFHAVKGRGEVPLTISASARQLAFGTGEAIGDRRASGLPYEVIQDQERLIAEFHGVGVLVINGTQGQADGYLINPERLSSNLIEYLFHFALI